MLLLISSCEKSDEPSKLPEFEFINELAGKNVFAIQFNTNDELIIGTSNNGIYIYNEVKNELKEVITKDKMWNIQNTKIAIGKSLILHYYRDFPQTYKSSDDGNSWSQFFIDEDKINQYSPIVSGNHFFVMSSNANEIFVLDSDFNFLKSIEIQTGNVNYIYTWFDGQILIKKELNGSVVWSVYNYENTLETNLDFNQPGDYQNFLIQDNHIWAYKIQGSKVFQSFDSGKSFTEVPNLPATTVHDVKIFNNALYVASDKGVFRTINQGQSWETLFTSAEEPMCITMNSKNKLYIVTVQSKVYKEK